MKLKTGLMILCLLFSGIFPAASQTLVGRAAGDFYSAFVKMIIDGKRFNTLTELEPYIPEDVITKLGENLVYRTAFIAFAANQYGIMSGNTSSVGFAETLKALTGFLMVIEESGEIKDWTIKEITDKYEQLIASSWRNVNPPLFTVMLDAYCSYKRGELWSKKY